MHVILDGRKRFEDTALFLENHIGVFTMSHTRQLVLTACILTCFASLPGCGGSGEATVTAPPADTVTAEEAKARQEAKDKQMENYDPRKDGGKEPDTGTGGSPDGI